MDKFSYIGNNELAAIEEMYSQYLVAPEKLDITWQNFFKGFEFARTNFTAQVQDRQINGENIDNEFKVIRLIEAYRSRGHLFTATNPVRTRRKHFPNLDIANFELSEQDMERSFQAGSEIGIGTAKLKDIITHLKNTYCTSIGVEYSYIRRPIVVEWLQKKMETTQNRRDFSKSERTLIYESLVRAVNFENFLHKKFVGQKRFSLEGAESLIPAMQVAINKATELGCEEFVIGMPHRGRLNVLTNILQKPYRKSFSEFITKQYDETISLGDVKYHLGYDNEIITPTGKRCRLNLAPNPSHLETVGGIIQGISRAKIDKHYNNNYSKLIPILIHGDAAIAGQGVVYEIVQMAQLDGYKTGGTLHIVVNNQVGFTTNYIEARSSTYCTDIAKVTQSPIFHVNGDDVEALAIVMELAVEFRQRFQSDVFIDILCYRKYGHNEGDEPRFTQPLLYKEIAKHPNTREIYTRELLDRQLFDSQELNKIQADFENLLEEEYQKSKEIEKITIKQFLKSEWNEFKHPMRSDFDKIIDTKITHQQIVELGNKINQLPQDKKFFKKIEKLVEDRILMIQNDKIDWSMAETLTYGSLIEEGYKVRISGQDVVRGTFSHRHAAFVVEDSEEKYFPLKNITTKPELFEIYNSPLNEYGVLGFEYGYALVSPNCLTIWEAQFGDFHNVAQAMIDQYISCGAEKWGIMNGLVMFLPHGYEGQGPEHSSARIERFLTLAARNNMLIANCTTPANLFHLIRLHLKRNFRIPLIIFTPKSLLRNPKCISAVKDFTDSKFLTVIDDPNNIPQTVTRVVLCSGKIYYDLLERQEKLQAKDVALIRVEQLYPFPIKEIADIIRKYPKNMLTLWIQEEPENMGAWQHIKHHLTDIEPVTRLASGSPAVGLSFLHTLGQEEIINKVFRKCDCYLKNNYCGLQCVVGKSRTEILETHRYLGMNTD